jgi:diguanylate cyclase (GGDEF)-like protein/PAS domain S-box-containing protein
MIERAWSNLSDAMVIATPGDAVHPPTVVVANAAFRDLFGLSEREVLGRPLGSFLSIDHEPLSERIEDLVSGRREAISDLVVVRSRSGSPKLVQWEVTAVRSDEGAVERLLALLHDVTRSAVRRPLGIGSDADPLTGLPNQLHLFTRLERSIEYAARAHPYSFAVLALETNGLQSVEHRLGSAMAATLLEAIVHRLRACLRAGDLITRAGPDRIVVVLEHFAPWGSPDTVLERILATTQEPYSIAGQQIALTTVGGAGPVCSQHDAPSGARTVMDAIEHAMIRARHGNGAPAVAAGEPHTGD